MPSVSVYAQTDDVEAETEAEGRGSFRYPVITPSQIEEEADVSAAHYWSLPNVIVDTDTGVDDAAALAWLFYQAGTRPTEIVGIATVAGNTSVDNATYNTLLLMAQTPWRWSNWPAVYKGADGPMSRPLSSTGKLLHGVDGLGYIRNNATLYGWNDSDYDFLVHDEDAVAANDLYCSDNLDSYGDITVIALGPLTNIAAAVEECPGKMDKFHFVILGGARESGNMTPTAEYNFWQDPESASIVFNAGLDITLIPRERFDTFTLTVNQVDSMLRDYPYRHYDKWAGLSDTVGSALCWYVGVQSADYSTGDVSISEWLPISVPDPSAMMYALQPYLYGAAKEPVLLQIPVEQDNPDPGLVRGESVIGYYSPYPEAVTMVVSDTMISGVVNLMLPADLMDPLEAAYRVAGMYATMAEWQNDIPSNASIPSDLYSYRMRLSFLSAFSVFGRPQRECFSDLGVASASGLGSTSFNRIVIPDPATYGAADEYMYIPGISK